MKQIKLLFIVVIAMFVIPVYAETPMYTSYKIDAFGMEKCYTEESVLANNYKLVESVNVGDRIVCDVIFETFAEDLVQSFSYTLVYGKSLKLVDEKINSKVDKKDNTYSLVLNNPTSVSSTDDIGSFTFEVVGTTDLIYGIKDIKFTTEDNKNYLSADKTNNLKYLWDDEKITFSKYKNNAFDMTKCYTEESVLANNYKLVESVKVGDKIVCDVVFETYAEDQVKSFKYTLSYGNGLKLIKENIGSLAEKVENTYSFALKDATSVSATDDIGSFTFEVVGTKDLTYGIKDIKFITKNKATYYSENISNSLKSDNAYLGENENSPDTGDMDIYMLAFGMLAFLGTSLVAYKKAKVN